MTIVPAAIAGAILVVGLLTALIPDDVERRLSRFAHGSRFEGLAKRLASAPATLRQWHQDRDRLRSQSVPAVGSR